MSEIDDLTARIVALEFIVAVRCSGRNPVFHWLVAGFRKYLAVQFPDADVQFLQSCEDHLRRAYDLNPSQLL